MSKLAPGDPAPAFTLPDADGNPISLSDYAGGQVIIYFYPAAMTPGCTKQAVDFTETKPVWSEAGYNVLGISPDAPAKLAKFREKQSVNFPLLSDEDRSVMEAFHAFGDKKLYGKVVQGVIRSTFIVDVDESGAGTIKDAQYNVRATGHVERLLRNLGV